MRTRALSRPASTPLSPLFGTGAAAAAAVASAADGRLRKRSVRETCCTEQADGKNSQSRGGGTFKRHLVFTPDWKRVNARSIRGADQSAASSASPVRMRTACSSPSTKIFPSPIWPVLAAGGDGVDRLVDHVARDGDLDFDLGQEAHGIFSAAINLGVAFLTAVALHLRNRKAVNADSGQSITDLFKLERLDDRHNNFHGFVPDLARSTRDRVPD